MGLRQKLREIDVFRITYRKFRNNILYLGDNILKLRYKLLGMPYVESFYARVNNFGDLFSSDLLKYLGYKLVYVDDYKKSQMSLTGSILQMYHQDFSGYVMGSGFIDERFDRSNNNWQVKIIRGPLSKAQCGYNGNCTFADPGILASVIFPKVNKKKYALGILPHCVDYEHVKQLNFKGQVKVISARQPASQVANEIQECEYIASSSLHGLIFADAFGIPNVHLRFGDKLIGGNHKFQDYYLGMDSKHDFIMFEDHSANEIINHCKSRFTDAYVEKKQNDVLAIYREVLAKLK